MSGEKRDRGLLQVDGDECKGCGLCVEACPPKVIALSDRLSHYGYRTATYAGSGCTACGICFLVCPEPGAITVLRRRNGVAVLHPATSGDQNAASEGGTEGAIECASN
jgi:NAD-dependent dihydropyrimidine dehydrogenase PreA subunit